MPHKNTDKLQQQINKLKPLKVEELEQLRQYYKIGITYSSNALEGNTLTESETKVVIEDGLTVGGKPLKDHLEAEGHAVAYDFMWKLAKSKGFTEKDIKNLHKLFYQKIDEKNAGKYRKIKAFISGSEFVPPPPNEVAPIMRMFVSELGINFGMHPIDRAARVHLDFVSIHPFVDGNGRVARLLMNLCLLQSGYPITIIPPIKRVEYIAALEKAHRQPKVFAEFIDSCVEQSQIEYLRLLS